MCTHTYYTRHTGWPKSQSLRPFNTLFACLLWNTLSNGYIKNFQFTRIREWYRVQHLTPLFFLVSLKPSWSGFYWLTYLRVRGHGIRLVWFRSFIPAEIAFLLEKCLTRNSPSRQRSHSNRFQNFKFFVIYKIIKYVYGTWNSNCWSMLLKKSSIFRKNDFIGN